MRRIFGVSIVIFLSVFLTGCEYVQFQRVQWDDETEEFIATKNFSKHFQENMVYVLSFFNEVHYVKNTVLYISRALWNDKEKLWNYCNYISNPPAMPGDSKSLTFPGK